MSPLFEVRVPPVLIEARAALPSVFEVLVPPFRVFLLATQELVSSYSNTNVYLYNITPIPLKTVEHCYSYSFLHYCLIVVLL